MSSVDPQAAAGDSTGSENSGNGHDSGHGNGHDESSNGNGMLTTIENRSNGVPALGWSYGPPLRPEILSAKASPPALLHAVRRRWPLAIGLGFLVGGVAAGLLWFLMPVKYEAFATLRVSGAPPVVLEKDRGAHEEFSLFKRTQVQLVLSNVVLQRTLAEPKINRLSMIQEHNDDPISWLKDQLIVDYPGDSEVMRIAIKAKKQSEAIQLVNEVVDRYLSEIIQREHELRLAQEEKLNQSYLKLVQEYERDWKALRDLEGLEQVSSTEAAQMSKRLAMDVLSEQMTRRHMLVNQLSDNEMSIMLMEARRDHPDETRPPDAFVDAEMNRDPIVTQLTQLLSNLNEALADTVGKSAHPESSQAVKRLREKIQQKEDALEDRKNTIRPQLTELQAARGGPGGTATQLSLPLLIKQREHLQAQFDDVQEDILKKAKAVEDIEKFSEKVAAKQESLAMSREIKNRLGQELDRVRVERLAAERITKVDDAALTNSKGDAIRKYVAVAFAFVLGFGVMVVGVAFVEFQARKINSIQDINDGLGIRVVGELPNVSGRTWRRIKGGKGPGVLKALMAERIDATRTALIHATAIDPPRVVMITSADPHEGKTTTASQLANSLARSGRRTLLIDADIRNPGAHRVFDLPQEPGLCELLRGEAQREAVIHPTRTPNLCLLPAGRCDLRSVQALSTSFLGTTIAALCVEFDYVVIDSGPVLKIADPLMVGQHVDAAIVSVLRDVSKLPKVYEACERLRSVGITVLGAVVNGVNDDVARHGIELLMAETPKSEKTTA
jgi:polysaccharide biosynthesis transport protein